MSGILVLPGTVIATAADDPVETTPDQGASYVNITTVTTTLVKTGSGRLERVIVNTFAPSVTINIYDNTVASGTTIGAIVAPALLLASHLEFIYGLRFLNGLTIQTLTAAPDLTVIFR